MYNPKEKLEKMTPEERQAEIISTYKDQLLIVLTAHLGGKVEIPLHIVDEYPVGKSVSLVIKGLRPAPELGPNRYNGTFVLQLIQMNDAELCPDIKDINVLMGDKTKLN